MIVRSGLMSLVLSGVVTASAHAEVLFSADSVVDDVWLYFEERCEATAVANEALKARVLSRLERVEGSVSSDFDEPLLNAFQSFSSELFVRSVAVELLGALALDEQVSFWQFVGGPAIASHPVTEGHLVNPAYASEFAEQRLRAAASFAAVDCLLPTADEVSAAKEQLDPDNVETQLWFEVVEAAYSKECESALLLLGERMLNIDFDSYVIGDEFMSNMDEHQLYIDNNPASERCEDFS